MKGEKMPVYKLEPTNEASYDWKTSEHKGLVIVRAQNENSARWKAEHEFGTFAKEEPGKDVTSSPWLQNNLVICKQFDSSEYEEEGPEEILFPKYDQL